VIRRSVATIDLLSVVDAKALSGAIVKKCKIFLGRAGDFFPVPRARLRGGALRLRGAASVRAFEIRPS
jgi:hypothetical protein